MTTVFLLVTIVMVVLNLITGMVFDSVMRGVKTIEEVPVTILPVILFGLFTKYGTYLFLTLTMAKFIADLF
jgi:hypothetical protein